MSEDLIHNVRLVEKYKNAIPALKRMDELGGCYYIAGSLVLSDLKDPVTGNSFTTINIKPIGDFESEIIKEAMYYASKIMVANKEGSCFYPQAVSNVEEYEKELA